MMLFSMLSASYMTTAWGLFLTYAMWLGTSMGVLTVASYSSFLEILDDEESNVALAYTSASCGVGIVVYSCFSAYFTVINSILSWEQLYRCYALSALLCVVPAVALACELPDDISSLKVIRNPSNTQESLDESSPLQGDSEQDEEERGVGDRETEHREKREEPKRDCAALLLDPKLIWLCISCFLFSMMWAVPYKFSVMFATSETSDDNMYYYVPVSMGSGDILAAWGVGYLSQLGFTGNDLARAVQLGCFGSTLFLALIGASNTSWVLFGLFLYGCVSTQNQVCLLKLTELMGRADVKVCFGVVNFAIGLGVICGGSLAGYLYDETSSFRVVFYLCAFGNIVSFLFDETTNYCWKSTEDKVRL